MREKSWFREYGLILAAGVAVGIAALILTASGNPKNMGFCIACFLRDIAGALGLHSAANVQYIRPEIIGIVVGAAAAALAAREFRAKAGASPACRFVLGMFVMIGALVFLGCPLRMVIRLGGGDLTAVAGLVGFIAGILVGVVCLKKGFSLGRAYPVRMGEGFVLSGILMALLGLLLLVPTLLKFSEAGPGSMRAFWGISLAAGLVVGVLAQRSRRPDNAVFPADGRGSDKALPPVAHAFHAISGKCWQPGTHRQHRHAARNKHLIFRTAAQVMAPDLLSVVPLRRYVKSYVCFYTLRWCRPCIYRNAPFSGAFQSHIFHTQRSGRHNL